MDVFPNLFYFLVIWGELVSPFEGVDDPATEASTADPTSQASTEPPIVPGSGMLKFCVQAYIWSEKVSSKIIFAWDRLNDELYTIL
jgi:hypothetical protein